MRKCFISSLMMVAAVIFGGTAIGQDYYSVVDRTEAMTEETVSSVSFMGGEKNEVVKGCDAKGCDEGCDDCCDSGCGVYVGIEMPWLQINQSNITSVFLDQFLNQNLGTNFMEFGIPPTNGQEPSWRIFGGIEDCDGFGIRASYWDFDDQALGAIPLGGIMVGGVTIDTLTLRAEYDFQVGDIEFRQRIGFCGWNLSVSTGVRIAQFEQVNALNIAGSVGGNPAELDIALGREFTGAGLTASFGWDRSIGSCGLGVYGNLRGSVLFGDTDYNLMVNPAGAAAGPMGVTPIDVDFAKVKDQPVVVTEIQLGLQYTRCCNYGVMFARAGVEGQVWELAPVALGLLDENIGLFGPTFAIGLER